MDYEGPSILMTSVRMPNRKDKDEEITWRTLTSSYDPPVRMSLAENGKRG